MYASYYYVAGAVLAEVLNDVLALLTGETDVNNLSPSCDKTQTVIDASIPAGWTLAGWEGTDRAVLTAPHSQDSTLTKYAVLSKETAGGLRIGSAKGFDGTTLSNPSIALSNYTLDLDLTNGGRLDIFAEGKSFGLLGYAGGTVESASMFLELEKKADYPVLPYGYVPSGSNYIYVTDRKRISTGTVYTTWSPVLLSFIFAPRNLGGKVELAKPFLYDQNYAFFNFVTSEIYRIPDGYGALFDTLTFNGYEFVVWKLGSRQIIVPRRAV